MKGGCRKARSTLIRAVCLRSPVVSRRPSGTRAVVRHDRPMSRDIKLLAGAAGVSALGDFLAVLPLVVHVQAKTGSAFAVSAIFFALWGPLVLAAGIAGSIVDRFENRALLIGVSFAQAACVAGIALTVDRIYVALPLLAFVGLGAAVGQPAEFALVPTAAGEGDIARANGL